MEYKIISRHLSWIAQGYSFRDIEAIRTELQQFSNALSIGTRELHECIGGELAPFLQKDLGKLTYLFIEDEDFDGDISFLRDCLNLRQLYIRGESAVHKISDLEPLRGLKQLELLWLEDQHIMDLKPLAQLSELKEIQLAGNPLESIAPITGLGKLESASFPSIPEQEVLELHRKSPGCRIYFSSREDGFAYEGRRLGEWSFKSIYFKEASGIVAVIEPIQLSGFRRLQCNRTLNYSALMREHLMEIAESLLYRGQRIKRLQFSGPDEGFMVVGRIGWE